ncbi:hypothetical protein GQR58_011363 [Nymphon striatum]|nr:hypothetical protein GQR58_011363 [Nymphon striatum]
MCKGCLGCLGPVLGSIHMLFGLECWHGCTACCIAWLSWSSPPYSLHHRTLDQAAVIVSVSLYKLHQALCNLTSLRVKVAYNQIQLLLVGRVNHLISNHRVKLGLSHTGCPKFEQGKVPISAFKMADIRKKSFKFENTYERRFIERKFLHNMICCILCNFNPLFLHWHLPTTHLVHPQRIRLLEIRRACGFRLKKKKSSLFFIHSQCLGSTLVENTYTRGIFVGSLDDRTVANQDVNLESLMPCNIEEEDERMNFERGVARIGIFLHLSACVFMQMQNEWVEVYRAVWMSSEMYCQNINTNGSLVKYLSVKMSKNKEDEELTPYIGRFGRWHLYIYVVVALMDVPGSMMIFVMTFYTPNMDFWCARPDHLNRSAISVKTWRNFSSPPAAYPPTESDGQCIRYDVDYHKLTELRVFDIAINKTTQCKHWEYDLGIYERTMIEESQSIPDLQPPTTDPVHPESSLAQKRSLFGEFDLVCSRNILISTSNSIYMAGFMVGVIASGHMADMFVFQLFFYSYQLYNFEMFECGYVSISPCAVD